LLGDYGEMECGSLSDYSDVSEPNASLWQWRE